MCSKAVLLLVLLLTMEVSSLTMGVQLIKVKQMIRKEKKQLEMKVEELTKQMEQMKQIKKLKNILMKE